MKQVALVFLILLCRLAGPPASAADVPPSLQEKLGMLADYSLALGRKFGCDSDGTFMVSTIKRYTYMLQFDDNSGTAPQDIAKKNLTAGINDTKTHQVACASVADPLAALDDKLRANRPLMESASQNVAGVAGAALFCEVPQDAVERMLGAVLAFARTETAEYSSRVANWREAGVAEVQSKQITCEAVKSIFAQVTTIFVP